MKRIRKKIPFSEAMDRKLIKLVDIYGTNNWNMIARNFKEQSAKKCKERWMVFLSPSVEQIPWTPEDDKLLLTLESQIGTKWTSISQSFTRRTPGEVRTRFRKLKIREMKKMKLKNNANEDVFEVEEEKEPIKQEQIVEKGPEPPKPIAVDETDSKYIIDKIFGPHSEEFLLEFSGLISFNEHFK